jgi:uncharacterized protein (TIGR02145 family)
LKYFIVSIFCFIATTGWSQSLYFPPTGSGSWDTLSAQQLGWCQPVMDSLFTMLDTNNTKAFILLKDGKIVIERYFNGHQAATNWYWASAGKTITSTLVGIAQQENFLQISDSSSDYLGAGWSSLSPQQEERITIRHQLTMTTGLDDRVSDLYCTDDTCLQYLAPPGTRWAYHNAPYTLLDPVIENATGRTLNQYMNQKIKAPTGMDGLFLPQGYNQVYFSTARSMARFGLLMLNRGVWDGTPVLADTAYFGQMTRSSQNINLAYGYLWWLNGTTSHMIPRVQWTFPGNFFPDAPADLYAALGSNGQFINVVPSQRLVWLRMGDVPNSVAVDYLLNNEIWKFINRFACSQPAPLQHMVGQLKYANSAQTPLAGVVVDLIDSSGIAIDRDTTSATGDFELAARAGSRFQLIPNPNYNSGGINATDALQTSQHFTASMSLSPLSRSAADVNSSGSINATDALNINRRTAQVILDFPAGNWRWDTLYRVADSTTANITLKIQCTGDVNASFVPTPTPPLWQLDSLWLTAPGSISAQVSIIQPGSGIFDRGICWSSGPGPTITDSLRSAGKGSFPFGMTIQTGSGPVFVRAYGRNSAGTYYSNERSILPPVCPTTSIRDTMGNVYATVAISNQCWMGSNLRTSRFRNGDLIAFPLTAQSWSSTFTPAHSIYNNSATNDSIYGRLYNAYAAADSRGLCPTGWHVPTDAEWNSLTNTLGGSLTAGFAMKNTSGWASSGNGTNSSGFTALPSGFRRETGAFDGILNHAYWWSSTSVPTNSANAYHRRVSFNAQNVFRDNSDKRLGYSIRCILD